MYNFLGTFYHVMLHRNGEQDIIDSDTDRMRFSLLLHEEEKDINIEFILLLDGKSCPFDYSSERDTFASNSAKEEFALSPKSPIPVIIW